MIRRNKSKLPHASSTSIFVRIYNVFLSSFKLLLINTSDRQFYLIIGVVKFIYTRIFLRIPSSNYKFCYKVDDILLLYVTIGFLTIRIYIRNLVKDISNVVHELTISGVY